jgi:hypothetical protein
MTWIGSVVGTADGVVTIAGAEVASVVGKGVATVVAGADAPGLLVQPADNTHSRITRKDTIGMRCFIAGGLFFIPISDLRFNDPALLHQPV